MAIIVDVPLRPVVGDVIQTKAVCFHTDQLGLNIRHWRVSAVAGLGATLTQIADFFDDLWDALYISYLTNTARWIGVMAKRVRPVASAEAYVNDSEGAGSGGLDSMPRQVAGLATMRTNLAGRRNRGRMFFPFPDVTSNDPPALTVDAPTVAIFQDIASSCVGPQTVVVAGNSTTLIGVLYHPKTGTTDDLVSAQAKTRWATQRRRGSFGRPNVRPG